MQMYDKIGNGGLCLRKVDSFIQACRKYAREIADFNARTDSMHNEDIFWALIPKSFIIPMFKLQLIRLKPRVCYTLNHKELPMGCRGFMHKSRMNFWKPFIPCIP